MEKTLKRFVCDTSALLSLSIMNIINETLNLAEIIITPSVIAELEEFAKFDDEYGNKSRELLNFREKFIIEKPKIKETLSFIQETDNELYNLAKENQLTLITDDIKLARHIEDKIDVQFSTYFLLSLVSSNIITKDKALEILEKIRDKRNWKNNIIYLTSKKELEEMQL